MNPLLLRASAAGSKLRVNQDAESRKKLTRDGNKCLEEKILENAEIVATHLPPTVYEGVELEFRVRRFNSVGKLVKF